MLCDVCVKFPATVHLTEIIDEQMNELHLCEACAREKSAQMEQHFGLSDLLAGMAEFEKPVKEKETEAVSFKCPNCGLTYADFKKIGRLGCSECYPAFKKYLAPLIKRIHGSNINFGKTPVKLAAKAAGKKGDLQDLRSQLAKALVSGDYDEEARLQDKIPEMESRRNDETK